MLLPVGLFCLFIPRTVMTVLFCNRLRGGLGKTKNEEKSPKQRLSVIFKPINEDAFARTKKKGQIWRGNDRAGSIRIKTEIEEEKVRGILPESMGLKPEENGASGVGSKYSKRGNIVILSLKVSV